MKVPYTAGAWPAPAGYLYGYVSTAVSGHRAIKVAGVSYPITTGYYRGDALVTQVDADVPGTWSLANGEVTTVQATVTLRADDWLLWLLGFGLEPAEERTGVTTLRASYVSPVVIPHLGAQWEAVDVARDVILSHDATLRGRAAVWGGARAWRWTLSFDPAQYAAFCAGWCLRGQVAVTGGDGAAISGGNADGTMTGHVVGVEGVDWSGPATLPLARVRLIVAGGTA